MIHARHRPDIHADLRQVGHQVHAAAALDRADVHRRRTHHRVRPGAELEFLQLRDRLRRLVDGVHAELRHRAVRRHALEGRVQLDRALVPDHRVVRGRLAHHDRARPAHQLRQRREVPRADAAALLRRRQHQHDAGRAVQFFRKGLRGKQDRRDPRLHVGRTAPVQLVAFRLAREGVLRPLARAERHHVEMPRHAQRRLAARAAVGISSRPRDDAGPAFLVFEKLDGKTPLLQQLSRHVRAVALPAGRVDGIEAKQVAGQRDGVRHGSCLSFSAV